MIPLDVIDVFLTQRLENQSETLATLIEDSFIERAISQCATCGRNRTTETTTRVEDAKEAVVVCLNRFLDNPLWQNRLRRNAQRIRALKNNRPIKLCDNVRLPLVNGNFATYELVSAVEHIGSPQSGHYCCHIKYDGVFYKANDDSKLRRSKVDNVQKSVVFLFKKVDDQQNAELPVSDEDSWQ